MLVLGAKGFAKEVLEVIHLNGDLDNLYFYDDVSKDIGDKIFNQFPVIRDKVSAKEYFKDIDKRFTVGIGNPILRHKMFKEFVGLGGEFKSTVSPRANIGSYSVSIGNGCNILDGVIISNDVSIGIGNIIYYNSIITHDCKLGEFVEISPNVKVLGRVHVGDYTQIGAGSIILPNLKIGKNVTIGAGSVVTKDVPDNCMILGIPAKIVKELEPLKF